MGNFQVLVRMQSHNRTTPYGIIRHQGWAPAILTHLSLLNERFLLFQCFKNLKIIWQIQISIHNTLASEKQGFRALFHQCYCLTGGVYVGFGTWLCMEHPIQHEWNPPLPDGGSAMVCVSSLFTYKYKHPCQPVCKRLSETKQHNHGGHAVPFLMELFGKVESWHEKV